MDSEAAEFAKSEVHLHHGSASSHGSQNAYVVLKKGIENDLSVNDSIYLKVNPSYFDITT